MKNELFWGEYCKTMSQNRKERIKGNSAKMSIAEEL